MRIPKGVTIDGKGVGGRFTAPDLLPGLIRQVDGESAEILLDFVYKQLDKSVRASERAERKFQDDPKRYARARESAEQDRLSWETIAQATDVSLLGAELHAQILDPTFAADVIQELEDMAPEWELGFDYNGMKGADHDFDLNVRLRRADGRAFGYTDARDAFRELMQDAYVPRGYQMASIHWRRPESGTGWRGPGTVNDLGSFAAPMYVHHDDARSVSIDPVTDQRPGRQRMEHGQVFRIGSVRR